MLAPEVMYWTFRQLGLPLRDSMGAGCRTHRHDGPRGGRGGHPPRQDEARLGRDPGQPAVDHDRHRCDRRTRARGRRTARRRLDLREPGAPEAAGVRRGHRDACGDEVPQRALRPAGRHPDDPRRQRALAACPRGALADRRHARLVRVLPPAPRDAHPVPAGAGSQRVGAGHRRALRRASAGHRRALPRSAVIPRPRGRRPADAGRFRRNAVDSGGGR